MIIDSVFSFIKEKSLLEFIVNYIKSNGAVSIKSLLNSLA